MILKEHLSVSFSCDVSWILGKKPDIYFPFFQVFCMCNSGGCGVFSFAFFIFSFGRPELRIKYYMFQWCHIDSECRFISNNLNRIHSHLKWPIMSNDSECATSQISGLSDPFGARSIHEILSCSLKRSRETISELGKFHHGFASPGMVNFMGEKWENIDERKGEKLGKRWWKTWETLNIWKKNWKTWGKIWGKHQMFFPWFSLFCANTVSCCRAPREQTGMAHFQYSIYPIDLNSQRSWCGAPGRIWQTLHESTWQLPEKLQADPSWCSTMDHKVRKRRGNEKTWADLFDEF